MGGKIPTYGTGFKSKYSKANWEFTGKEHGGGW